MAVVNYSSNNSGGSWWLTDEDWYALERAGWTVQWVKDDPHRLFTDGRDRWLGALATSASKDFTDPSEAIEEWERITGQDASEPGCNCCGEPHNFSYTDDAGNYHYSSVCVTETAIGFD